MYVRIVLPLKIAINNQILKTTTPFAVIFFQQRLSSPVVDWFVLLFLIRFNKRREWFEMACYYNAILTHLLASIWYSTHNHKIPYHFLVFFHELETLSFHWALCVFFAVSYLFSYLKILGISCYWQILPNFFCIIFVRRILFRDIDGLSHSKFSTLFIFRPVLFVVDVLWISLAR